MAVARQYDDVFYANQKDGSYKSASVIIPLLIKAFAPRSVIDVGCGVGTWLHAFQDHGVEDVLGIDGDYVSRDRLQISASRFRPMDLTGSLSVDRRFDLAISLEVAEHLPTETSDRFVEFLTQVADTVVFSAALPSQGGTTHVNEQWQSFWAAKFATAGFLAYDFIRPAIWNDSRVEFWYQQNIITYAHPRAADAHNLTNSIQSLRSLDLVHPTLLQRRTDELPGVRNSIRGIRHALVSRLRRALVF